MITLCCLNTVSGRIMISQEGSTGVCSQQYDVNEFPTCVHSAEEQRHMHC